MTLKCYSHDFQFITHVQEDMKKFKSLVQK